jgi:tetratricopeptide (TPR) repeat protein
MHSILTKILSVVVVVFLLTACEENNSQEANKSTEYLARASSYFDQGQYKVAIIEIQNALQEDSNNIDAYALLGEIYYAQGNHLLSMNVLDSAPTQNEKTILLIAKNNLSLSKAKSALNVLNDAYKNNLLIDSIEASLIEAKSLVLLNKVTDAEKLLNKISNKTTNEEQLSDIETAKAKLFARTNRPQDQVTALNKAIKLHPSNIDALVMLADYHYRQNDYEAAEDKLSEALYNLPTTDSMTLKRMQILRAMVAILSQQGRSAEAMVYSKIIADANPKSQEIESEFQTALDALGKGDIDEAEKILTKLFDSSPNQISGSLLGLIKYSKGEFSEASNLFDRYVDPETASSQALSIYAETELRLKKPADALKAIESNIKDHSDNPKLLSVYGLALLYTGQTEKGIEVIKSTLQLDPTMSKLRLALIDNYNAQGKSNLALEQLELAHRHSPDDPHIAEKTLNQYSQMGLKNKHQSLINTLAASSVVENQVLAGLSLLQTNPKRAADIIDKAYQKEPKNLYALNAKTIESVNTKNTANTVKYAKETLNIDENRLFALAAIATAYSDSGNDKKAVDFLKEESNRSVNSWAADFLLSKYYLKNLNYKDSIRYLESSLSKSSFNDTVVRFSKDVYLANAAAEINNANYASAKKSIMDAIQLAPNDLSLQHFLISVELGNDNLTQAQKIAEEIEQLAPKSQTNHLVKGDISKHQGQHEEALLHYLDAWSIAPSDKIGKVIWANLRFGTALTPQQFIEDWKEKLPNSFEAITIEAMSYQEKNQIAKAMRSYKKSLELNPNQPIALNNIAWIYFEQKQYEQALSHAEQANKLAPQNPAILDTYGWIAFKSGDKDKAKDLIGQATKLAPNNAEIASHYKEITAK